MFLTFYGECQNFEYKVQFDGIGDNREFFSGLAYPQTILGSRGAFEVGVSVDEHRIRVGASKLYEFGSSFDYHKPQIILYYQYLTKENEFLMGSFARRGRLNFPLAMLTDTLLYYRPNIDGLYYESKWDWGRQNVFVDWTSRQTDTIRENFMAGFSGEIFYKNIFIENYFLMYHDAGPGIPIPNDNIKDYLGFMVLAGIRTGKEAIVDGYVKAGLLNSNFRERDVINGTVTGNSLYVEAFGKYKKYGIKTTLSTGDGHIFNYGDRFYRAKNYLRTDLLWYFINHKNIKAVFNVSLHLLNWNDLENQQQLSIIYKFGDKKPIKLSENN